jgi:hypothetical protein
MQALIDWLLSLLGTDPEEDPSGRAGGYPDPNG